MATISDFEDDDNTLYVGVIGYFSQKFDETEAEEILEDALNDIEEEYIDTGDFEDIAIVSGLVNAGMNRIAYKVADFHGYKTIGIAPEEAKDMDNYPVDEIVWSGVEFGDESEDFIDAIDVLVKIGGGAQSQKELEIAEEDGDISILEYDLDSLGE